MKPDGPVARRHDYIWRPVEHKNAVRLIEAWHYAKGASRTSVHSHGLFRTSDGEMVGAALWMPPTKVAAQSVAGDEWRGVLALSRLVVAPGEPKNTTGMFLAASVRMVRRDTRWHTGLTYADSREGHTGTIYRATGWEYLGEVPGSPKWIDQNGRQVSQKATRTRTVAEMRALGYTRLDPLPKHKFKIRLAASALESRAA